MGRLSFLDGTGRKTSTLTMVLSASLLSCRGSRIEVVKVKPPQNVLSKGEVAGIWDWQALFRTENGDLQAEQESWFLQRKNTRVFGRYLRVLTRISMDGRVFGCNGKHRYVVRTVFTLEGKAEASRLFIKESKYQVQQNPCDTSPQRLDEYTGWLTSKGLVLSWGKGNQVLRRRDLTGVWIWRRVGLDKNGDKEVVAERWRIRQHGLKVHGQRYRRDHHVSNDSKRFMCNGRLEMSRYAYWPFSGRIATDSVGLSFGQPLARPGPCEQRNLSYTEGKLMLSIDPDTLEAELPEGRVSLQRWSDSKSLGVAGDRGGENRRSEVAKGGARDSG